MNLIKPAKRILSSLLTVCFFVTNVIFSFSPAYASEVFLPAFESGRLLQIPADLGSVTRQQVQSGKKILIHIQSSHRLYKNEINVEAILRYLKENYGIDRVFLEGGWERLRPDFFRLFKGRADVRHKLIEHLVENGDLTGAEAFLIKNDDVLGQGAEDSGLYFEDGRLFKTVFEQKETAQSILSYFRFYFERLAASFASRELLQFFRREDSFEKNRLSYPEWISYLKTEAKESLSLDLTDIHNQNEWPFLIRYVRLQSLEYKPDFQLLQIQGREFLEDLANFSCPPSLQRRAEAVLQEAAKAPFLKKQISLPGHEDAPANSSARTLFEKIFDYLPPDYQFDRYPELRAFLEMRILEEEMMHEALFEEVDRIADAVINSLAKTAAEKKLASFRRTIKQLAKLLELQLTRREFLEYFSSNKGITIEKLREGFRNLSRINSSVPIEEPPAFPQESLSVYDKAVRFYRIAIEREDAMIEKIANEMRTSAGRKTVLITGGFHSEGIENLAAEHGLSYFQITPMITEIDADFKEKYLRAALGGISVPEATWEAMLATSWIAAQTENPFYREVTPGLARNVTQTIRRGISLIAPATADSLQAEFEISPLAQRLKLLSAPAIVRAEARKKEQPPFIAGYGIKPPYDNVLAYQIEQQEPSKEIRAVRQVQEVFKRFDRDTEQKNRERLRQQFSEEDKMITVSRFGRASYFLMLLASASRYLTSGGRLAKIVTELEDFLSEAPAALQNQILRLRGAVDDLARLVSEEKVTHADLQGRRMNLLTAIQIFQAQAIRQIDRARERNKALILEEKKTGPANESKTATRLRLLSNEVQRVADNTKSYLEAIDEILTEDKGRDANFSVFLQRASETGVRNIVRVNHGKDPFEADEEHIAEAIQEAGENVYASPDNAWLEVADYWIEALPLFIHEVESEIPGKKESIIVVDRDRLRELILESGEPGSDFAAELDDVLEEESREIQITLEDGSVETKVVIEQEAFEAVLRQLAPHWVRNIQNVMDSENIAMARRLIASEDAELRNAALAEAATTGSEEEAMRQALKRRIEAGDDRHYGSTIGVLAALIHETSRLLAGEIAAEMDRKGMLRYEALYEVLTRDTSSNNLYARAVDLSREKMISLREAAFEVMDDYDRVNASKIASKVQEYVDSGNLLARRREIPTWIILTTQAAGMSNMFASFWLEEEMGLYALASDMSVKGKTLEQEAKDLSKEYEGRIVELGREVIRQFNLGWKLEELIPELGENRAILSLLNTYPELRKEVSKIAVLWDRTAGPDENRTGEPPAVLEILRQKKDQLEAMATESVIDQNQELKTLSQTDLAAAKAKVETQEAYKLEREKIVLILARNAAIQAHPEQEFLEWYTNQYLRLHLPGGINMGLSTARKEVLSRYFRYEDGTLEHVQDWVAFWKARENQGVAAKPGQPLWNLLNHPLYAYEATGANKKYNKGYGPSRVDLGAKERYTVQVLPQWVGPVDGYSKEAMSRFYRLYNFNVRAFDDVRIAEILKPGENHSMEQALFHAHRMQSFNRAIGVGNYSWLAFEWNDRSELFMRAAGSCSGGFCQPKDIYFLPLVVGIAQNDTLRYAGIPVNKFTGIKALIRRVLVERSSGRFEEDAKWRAWVLQELANHEVIREAFGLQEQESQDGTVSFLFNPERFIPPLARLASSLNEIGVRDPQVDPHGFINSLAADYHGRGKGDDEGGMRFAAVELIHTIQQALDYANRKSNGETPRYDESVIALASEYKPVPDVRLAIGIRLFEFMAGTGEHLMEPFTPEARAISNLILKGYNPQDRVLRLILKRALNVIELDNETEETLKKIFPAGQKPADIRLFSPFNMTLTSILDYVTGTQLKELGDQARATLRDQGLSDEQINANILTHGPKLEKFTKLRKLPKEKLVELKQQLEEKLFALALLVRMDNQAWRQGPGSDLWEAIRGTDVNTILVHYPEITGDEDAGTEILDPLILGDARASETEVINPAGIMIRDLGRVRDTMLDGRPHSALIFLDAPTQGRKNALDIRGIQQWQALNTTGKRAVELTGEELNQGRSPVYVSPGVPQEEAERYEQQMRTDRKNALDLYQALKSGDYEKASGIYAQMQRVAPERLAQARSEEELAKSAARWWRGGGFLNFSERHRFLAAGHLKMAQGLALEDLDWATFLISGGMYVLNGEPQEDIEEARARFEITIKNLKAIKKEESKGISSAPFSGEEIQNVESLFVAPKFVAPIEELKQIAGERTSLKRREVTEESAAGKALENFRLMQQARAKAKRGEGFKKAGAEAVLQFDAAYAKAKTILADGESDISYYDYGRFLGYARNALLAAVGEIIPDENDSERVDMQQRLHVLFGNGREIDPANWEAIAGLKEDIGDFGRLGKQLGGDRERLRRLTKAMELFLIVLLLEQTLEYRHMSEEDVERIGEKKISGEVWAKIARFFSMSVYDHYFDYTPKIITPAESGSYLTDYHFIMGENYDPMTGRQLGPGSPFTRDEIIQISAEMYEWTNAYLNHLILTKTGIKNFSEEERKAILGSPEVQAIGVANEDSKDFEKRWWTITQKRELAYQDHDGHHVAAIFDDCENCAEAIGADRIENGKLILGSRPNIAIVAPAGRTHITTFFEENPTYNRENPTRQSNWIVTREGDFQIVDIPQADGRVRRERVMTIRSGFAYVSAEEYVRMRQVQLSKKMNAAEASAKAEKEAADLLRQNPKGILVAIRFKQPIVSSVSFPFHGAPYYLRGEDEKAGLPSSQPWISNYLFYNKVWHTLIHDPDSGVVVPPEIQWRQDYQRDPEGKQRDKAALRREILEGREGFEGLLSFAQRHWKIIAKAAGQSGGRGSIAEQITDATGKSKPEVVDAYVEHLTRVGQIDDTVIQKLIVSDPRVWASPEYMHRLVDGLIQKGLPVPEWAKFFVYSRMIAVSSGKKENVEDEDEYDYVLELVVSSLQAISNVGSGGVLMKSRPALYRTEQLARLMHERRKRAAHNSMRAIEKTAERVAGEIEAASGRQLAGTDKTGTPYTYPRYIMHDFLDVPVISIQGKEVQFPEIVNFEMDEQGNVIRLIVLDENQGVVPGEVKWVRVKQGVDSILDWQSVLIENNIGYGLWAPFKYDERDEEIQRAKAAGENPNPANWGRDLRTIMKNFTQAGYDYMRAVAPAADRPPPAPAIPATLILNFSQEEEQPLPDPDRKIILRNANELSKALQDLTLEHILSKRNTKLQTIRQQAVSNPHIILEVLDEAFSFLADPDNKERFAKALQPHITGNAHLLLTEYFLNRVAQAVAEQIFSASQAGYTEIRIDEEEEPADVMASLGGEKNHALIFSSFLGLNDELLAMHVSAQHSASEEGKPVYNVFAVHPDWILRDGEDAGKTRKVLYYDFGRRRFVETTLETPLAIDRVQYKGSEKKETLSKFFKRLDITQVNPFLHKSSAASLAEDKAKTTEILKKSGIDIPETRMVPRFASNSEIYNIMSEYLEDYFERHPKAFQAVFRVQPNRGTEGVGARVVTVSRQEWKQFHRGNGAVLAVLALSKDDDVIIRDEIGNVRYGDHYRRVTFRLNASFDGEQSHVESGFVQAGALGSDTASIAQGGEILDLFEVSSKLRVIDADGSSRHILSPEEWQAVKEAAEKALTALNDTVPENEKLLFAGIDIEVDIFKEEIKAFVLDVNPQPEGLMHSRRLSLTEKGELLVTPRLFAPAPERSEVRRAKNADVLGFLDIPSLRKYAEEMGIRTQSVFRTATEITRGILPVALSALAASPIFFSKILDAAKIAPSDFETEKEFVKARGFLGVSEDSTGNIFVLGPDFSFNMGLLPALREIYPHSFLIVIAQTPEQNAFLEKEFPSDPNLVVAENVDAAAEKIKEYRESRTGAAIRPTAFLGIGDSSELLQALRVKQTIAEIQTITEAKAREFLALTNDAVTSLVQSFKARFSIAKSA